MIVDDLRRSINREISPDCFDEITLRIHEIEIDAMVYQIVLPWLHVRRRGKIYSVRLTHVLHLLPSARHAQNIIMELGQISSDHLRRVSGWITRDEYGQKHVSMLLFHSVNHTRHLIQLFGTDVWTVCETEVHQTILSLHVLLGKIVSIVVHKVEWAAYERSADAFVRLGDALTSNSRFLITKIDGEADTRNYEEEASLP